MVFLIFQIGSDRYAIHAPLVIEVLPMVKYKAIPGAATGIAGVFCYHGEPVPVIDLSLMVGGPPVKESMGARLVIVRCGELGTEQRSLGVLAEMVKSTMRFRPEEFRESGISVSGAPHLGPVVQDAGGIIQWVKVEKLLSAEVRQQLWQQAEAALC